MADEPEPLKPGPEMDAAISRILDKKDWVKHDYMKVDGDEIRIATWMPAGWGTPDRPGPGIKLGQKPPGYSKDPHCLRVLKSDLLEHGYGYTITCTPGDPPIFEAAILPGKHKGAEAKQIPGTGETEEEAFCRAVLVLKELKKA